MKFFLLTVLLAVSAANAAPSKFKRDILPGDSRFGTAYHLQHHHAHSSGSLSQYLPPASQPAPQPNNQYLEPVANVVSKQSLELPSTSYGVPFKNAEQQPSAQQNYLPPNVNSVPTTSYGTPAQQIETSHNFHHAAPAPVAPAQPSFVAPAPVAPAQPSYVAPAPVAPAQQSYVAPAPVPHTTYGVPSRHQQQQVQAVHHQPQQVRYQVQQVQQQPQQVQHVRQPAPVYGAPVQQVHRQVEQVQQVHHQIEQVQQVHHQPAPVYGAPVQQVYRQPAPVQQVHYQPAPVQQVRDEPAPVQQVLQQVQQVQQPAPVYSAPSQRYQQQQQNNGGYQYQQPAQVHTAPEKLVFEAPVQSIEVSQSHSVETLPDAPAHVEHDSVNIESVSAVRQPSYTQQTDSNGGYVY